MHAIGITRITKLSLLLCGLSSLNMAFHPHRSNTLCFFGFLLLFHGASAQLSSNYYSTTCPKALSAIRIAVSNAVFKEHRMGASLLRLHFHDCFVNACSLFLSFLSFVYIQHRPLRTWSCIMHWNTHTTFARMRMCIYIYMHGVMLYTDLERRNPFINIKVWSIKIYSIMITLFIVDPIYFLETLSIIILMFQTLVAWLYYLIIGSTIMFGAWTNMALTWQCHVNMHWPDDATSVWQFVHENLCT